jgi:hypothetical protein
MTARNACLFAGLAIAAVAAAVIPAAAKDAGATHELVAKIVAVDLAAKSIRIEGDPGSTQVLYAVGKAAEHLDELPVGEKFKLTVRDGDDGNRREVVAIKRMKNASSP